MVATTTMMIEDERGGGPRERGRRGER